MKKTIGVDLDSVLAEIDIATWHNSAYGSKKPIEEYRTYDLTVNWGCSPDDVRKRVHEFYESEIFARTLPVSGSVEGVSYLSQKYDLVVITSRPQSIEHMTLGWLSKFFKNAFKEVVHTNHMSRTAGDRFRHKSDVCKEHSITTMIDDAVHFAEDCAHNDISVFLLEQPWNKKARKLHPRITRIKNWQEIKKYL